MTRRPGQRSRYKGMKAKLSKCSLPTSVACNLSLKHFKVHMHSLGKYIYTFKERKYEESETLNYLDRIVLTEVQPYNLYNKALSAT